MKKRYLRFFASALFACSQFFSYSQAKLTNFTYGLNTALGGLFPQGNNLYFIGRYDATTQEWMKLDLSNTNTGTNTALVTNDHFRATTGSTIFRTPFRFGSNVFIASAKPTTAQDIEFSRFDLSSATEQWINIYTGNNSNGTPNYSDPIVYGQDAATGKVYFNANTASGNQYYYWDPATGNITQLTTISGGSQQNSSANMLIYGDNIYTGGYSGSTLGMVKVNKMTGAFTFYNYYGARSFTVANNKIYFTARPGTNNNQGYNAFMYNPADNSVTQLTNYTTETIADGNLSGFVLTPDQKHLFVNVSYYNTSPVQGSFFSINTLTNEVTYRSGPTLLDRNFYFWSTNNAVYVQRFAGGSTTTRSLYKIDLATNTSTLLTGSATYTTFGTPINGLDGSIYLSGTDATYGSEVYSFKPATDELTRLTDISAGGGAAGNSNPNGLVAYNSKLYFLATGTGTASPDYEIYSMPIGAILPLKWISFSATPTRTGTVQLSWKVAAVQHVKHFAVEVSTDGSQWEEITTVSAGNRTDYQYLDIASRDAKVVFYKIKEVSADGSYSYSPVQKVLLLTKAGSFALLHNPSENNSIGVSFSAAAVKAELSITNANGRVVARKQWNGGAGTLQLPVANAGVYIVKFADQSLRAVVQ